MQKLAAIDGFEVPKRSKGAVNTIHHSYPMAAPDLAVVWRACRSRGAENRFDVDGESAAQQRPPNRRVGTAECRQDAKGRNSRYV